jgi:hypothetical protein
VTQCVCGVTVVLGTAVHLYCGTAQLCCVQGGTVVRFCVFLIRDGLDSLPPVRPALGITFPACPGGRVGAPGGRFGDTVHCTMSLQYFSLGFTAVLQCYNTVVLLYTALCEAVYLAAQ